MCIFRYLSIERLNLRKKLHLYIFYIYISYLRCIKLHLYIFYIYTFYLRCINLLKNEHFAYLSTEKTTSVANLNIYIFENKISKSSEKCAFYIFLNNMTKYREECPLLHILHRKK